MCADEARGGGGRAYLVVGVMPVVTSGNTDAPSLMIGERAADFIADGA